MTLAGPRVLLLATARADAKGDEARQTFPGLVPFSTGGSARCSHHGFAHDEATLAVHLDQEDDADDQDDHADNTDDASP